MRPELYISFLFGSTISPECILVFGLLLILSIDLIGYRKKTTLLCLIALASLLVAEAVLSSEPKAKSVITFLDLFGLDDFGRIFQSLVVLSSIICVLLSIEYIERTGTTITELLVFLLMGTIGGMFLCSANDFVTIFVSLECLSLSSYLLCSYTKKDIRSNEAAIKYLLMGGLNSSIFAYGFSWLYGLSGGKIDIKSITSSFSSQIEISDSAGFFIALTCIVIGLAFKLSLVPFHQWTPDIYEGSPTPVVAFLSVTSKIASIALTTRIFNTIFMSSGTEWKLILEFLAISSMVLGNLVAITQTSMKRMLAYSSISQIGYIIIGLVTGDSDGFTSMIVYIFFYIFMGLGTFACVISVSLRTGTDNIRDYEGLYTKDPILSLSFTLCLLSLGGFPPLTGFFGKLYLFWCGWQAGLYLLVSIGLVTSIFSIYYYLKIIKSMIYSKNQFNSYIETCIAPSLFFSEKKSIEFVTFLCAVGATFFGSLTSPIRDFIQDTLGLNFPFLD